MKMLMRSAIKYKTKNKNKKHGCLVVRDASA